MTPLVLALLVAQAATRAAPVKLRNDDAAVIEAAMAQFFTPEEETWQSRGWRKGERAIVHTQLASKRRLSVDEILKTWIDPLLRYENDAKYADQARKELAPMRALQTEVAPLEGTYAPPPILPLATLNLGPKVVVGDPIVGRFGFWHEAKLPNGDIGRPRVIARLAPPAYSRDGRIALVTMNAPWSIHSADILIALRREGDTWTRIFARSHFFV